VTAHKASRCGPPSAVLTDRPQLPNTRHDWTFRLHFLATPQGYADDAKRPGMPDQESLVPDRVPIWRLSAAEVSAFGYLIPLRILKGLVRRSRSGACLRDRRGIRLSQRGNGNAHRNGKDALPRHPRQPAGLMSP
jgi:hypothetical protein